MRMKGAPVMVVALLAAFLSACAAVNAASTRSGQEAPGRTSFAEVGSKEPARVLKVIGGDTLQILYKGQEETVRLKGLDLSGKDSGRAAEDARRLGRLLKGKRIEVATVSSSKEERDEEGRLLVTLFAEGENVNEMLRAAERLGFDGEMDTLHEDPDELPEARSDSSPPPPPKKKKNTPTIVAKVTYDKVYITPRDKTYHKANCRLLSGVRAVPVLREHAVQQGYKPCRRCKP